MVQALALFWPGLCLISIASIYMLYIHTYVCMIYIMNEWMSYIYMYVCIANIYMYVYTICICIYLYVYIKYVCIYNFLLVEWYRRGSLGSSWTIHWVSLVLKFLRSKMKTYTIFFLPGCFLKVDHCTKFLRKRPHIRKNQSTVYPGKKMER